MRRARDIFATGFTTDPYWWEAARPTAEGSVAPPAETEVAIVGSGYGGLAAALELARLGVEATVLEAREFGHGASTRNGGHVSGGVNLGKGASNAATNGSVGALLAESIESFAHIEGLIEREAIACHYVRCGRFVGAVTPAQFSALARKAETLTAAGLPAEMVPRERQGEEVGSARFHGGMLIRDAGSLHPALYHRGLLEACRRNGVRLCAETAVTGIQRADGAATVTTTAGPVRARHVVVATNGYTGPATPWLRRRVVPVGSYIIATEPLPEAQAQALIPQSRTLSDSKRLLNYWRLSPDGRRLLFGGRGSFSGAPPEETAQMLYRMMLEVYPQLDGVRITHAWTGGIAFTFDFLPHMGTHDGVHYAMGCNGSGVATMTWLGHQLALKIRGGNRPSAFDGLPFPTRPFYRGDPWFLPLVGRWYELRDRIERMRA